MKKAFSFALFSFLIPAASFAGLKSDCLAAAKQDHPKGHVIRTALHDDGNTATIRFREQGLTYCQYIPDPQTGVKTLRVETIRNCYTIVNWEQSVFGTYTPCDSASSLD